MEGKRNMAGFKGHLTGGAVFAGAAVGVILYQSPEITGDVLLSSGIVAVTTMVGSLLPDIDHPESFLGRRLRLISKPVYRWFGHRTLTHSLFFMAGVTSVLAYCQFEEAGIGLGLGILSHILLDFLSLGSGVALLYPLYPKRIYLNSWHYIRKLFKKLCKKLKRSLKKAFKKKKKSH